MQPGGDGWRCGVQRGGGLLAMEIVAPFACLKKRSQNTVAAGCVREKYCSGWLMNSAAVRRNQPAGLKTSQPNGAIILIQF